MRFLMILALTAACLAPGPAGATPPPTSLPADTLTDYQRRQSWFSRDKGYHFAVSALGSGGVYAAGRALGLNRWQSATVSALIVGSAGVWREIGTNRRDDLISRAHLSRRDLLWNGLGIAVGISLSDLLLRDPEPTR